MLADMVADMAADREVHIVADMEVDKVADMAPTEKKKLMYARKRSWRKHEKEVHWAEAV